MTTLLVIAIFLILVGIWLVFSTRQVKTLSKGTFFFPVISFMARLTNSWLGYKNPEPGYTLKSWERKSFGIFFIVGGLVILMIVLSQQG